MANVIIRIKQIFEGKKEAKDAKASIEQLTGVIGKLTTAAAVMAPIFKKAFDLGKEGATLNQLEESFNRMNEQVFRTPDLLNKMSAAARGTIKDTDLMRGLMTLTAGASDEMAKRFAQASPRLLEIAKAANALNPTLGDTAFMYESIATGIKRSSPLILDNLGIVVKLGDANEKMAQALGKSVSALTAEEKQMALLNAVMESGDTLIRQVGDGIDAQTDSWLELETAVGTAGDEVKQYMGRQLTPLVTEYLRLVKAVKESRDEFFGWGEEARNAARSAAVAMDADAALLQTVRDYTDATKEATDATEEFTGAFDLSAMRQMIDKRREEAQAIQDSNEEWRERRGLQIQERMEEEAEAAADAAAAMAELAAKTGDYFMQATDMGEEQPDWNKMLFEQAGAAGASAEQLAILGVATGELTKEQAEAALQTAIVMAAIDKLAQEFVDGEKSIQDIRAELDKYIAGSPYQAEAELDADEAIAKAVLLKGLLDGLDGRVTRSRSEHTNETINVTTDGKGGSNKGGAKGQHGLNMIVPPGFHNDDFNIGVSSGEHVVVTPAPQVNASFSFNGGIHVTGNTARGIASEIEREIAQALRQFSASGMANMGRTV